MDQVGRNALCIATTANLGKSLHSAVAARNAIKRIPTLRHKAAN
jgi:hypothetical protein